jgi:DNA-binding MarR family transcriptional regulator
MEWLLLETIEELRAETEDQVTQNAIAKRTGMSPSVISYWVTTMGEYGAVERSEHDDSRACSVALTDGGRLQLELCNERLEAAGLTG